MKLTISERCRYCLISLLVMLYFILMFPPVQYKKIGLMYGYSGFDQGVVSWSQLIMEIIIVTFIAVIIYLIYPIYKRK
jgi:uncharacterized membrane protein